MSVRLPAAALALAAVVGTFALLQSNAGHALVARLDHWYDGLHGFGDPCADRGLVAHQGPYGVAFDMPRCWTAARSEEGGVSVETILDPGLRKGFSIRYIQRADTEIWSRAMDAMDRRLASPMANVSDVRGWRVVGTASQRPGSKAPSCYFEWAISNGEVAVLVALEIHKFYVAAPKTVELVKAINDVMHSIRGSGTEGSISPEERAAAAGR